MTTFIFMWLLPLTASSSVTSALPNNFTNDQFIHKQMTTKMSTLEQISKSFAHKMTSSTTLDVNSTQERSRSNPLLKTTQTPRATTTQKSQTSPTPKFLTLVSFSQNNFTNSTGKTTHQKSVTTIMNSQTSSNTSRGTGIGITIPSEQSQFTKSLGPWKTSAFEMTSLSEPTSQSKTFISAATSIKHDTSTSSLLDNISSVPFKTTAGRTSSHITVFEQKNNSKKMRNKTNHSKVVAGVIGGALSLMMVGFLVIYMKKHKLQKQQLITTDWAGPSPFLESDVDKVIPRSSNRISLSSFLPQRLSKRLSLLPEKDEELQDMTPSATFGGKDQEIISGQGEDKKYDRSGSVVVVSEKNSKGEGAETSADCVSENSSKRNSNPNINQSEANKPELNQSFNQSELMEKSTAESKNGLGSP